MTPVPVRCSASMPLDHREAVSLLSQLAEQEDLRVTLRSSLMGSLLAGLGAFIGGVTLGPPGLLLGERRTGRCGGLHRRGRGGDGGWEGRLHRAEGIPLMLRCPRLRRIT